MSQLHVEPTQRSLMHFFRGCLGKKRYPSLVAAEEKARECEALRPVALTTYDCTFCGGWHLARVPQEGQPRCGVCLISFDPSGPEVWRCSRCADRVMSAECGLVVMLG